MKTLESSLDRKLSSSSETKEQYLTEGFIDGSKIDRRVLTDQMWNKKIKSLVTQLSKYIYESKY